MTKILKYRELPSGSTESKETHKQCTGSQGCQEVKLRSHFTNDSSKADGKRNRCKQCQRAYNTKYASNRRASDKKYRAKPEQRLLKYKRSAESRGFTWDMTTKEFMTFWKLNCTHCGTPIETIGLDRLRSDLPYTKDNCQPCCSTHNRQKSDMDLDVWYDSMDSITLHRLKINNVPDSVLTMVKGLLKDASGEEHNKRMSAVTK